VALLAARLGEVAPDDLAHWVVPQLLSFLSRVRALARETLQRWGLHEIADLAVLLLNELVTEALIASPTESPFACCARTRCAARSGTACRTCRPSRGRSHGTG
jgi:hypothetical protein